MKRILKLCFNTSEWSPNRPEWLRLILSLPKSERDRIGAFAFKRDSKNSLIGQILLRIGLKRLIPNLELHNMMIERNQRGRPCVKLKEFDLGLNIVDSNLSHAGDLCVVVVGIRAISKNNSENSWLGLDCMKVEVNNTGAQTDAYLFEKEIAKYDRVIKSKYLESEKEYIYSQANSLEKLAAFYRIWCLKESYAKATGLGISGLDISKVEIQLKSILSIDPIKTTGSIIDNSKLIKNGKIDNYCRFYEQYWIPRINSLDLHIITICLIDEDNEKLEKWGNAYDEFIELSSKEMFDEFSKADSNNEAKVKDIDDLSDIWTTFYKKL